MGDPLFANLSLFEHITEATKNLGPDAFPGKSRYILSDQEVPQEVIDRIGPVLINLDSLTQEHIAASVFYVAYQCDSDALPVIRSIRQQGGSFVPHMRFTKVEYRFVNRTAHNAMSKTWSKGDQVSHLHAGIHENICEALELTSRIDGDYVEIGVYRGGSALTSLNFLDELCQRYPSLPKKKAWLIDTFDGFTYDEAATSFDALWSGTHQLYGKEQTMSYLRDSIFNEVATEYELVASNICADPLPAGIRKIAVANVDVDMYEATLAALHRVAPLMAQGGIIIAEDPTSTPGLYGALLALEEFMESPAGAPFYKIFKGSQYFLIKMR